jgi:threonine dehydratase
LKLIDVFKARTRIAPYVRRTPLVESAWLSDLASARVSLKLESLQMSSSFKWRGAFNAVAARIERGRRPSSLVTASAGNHGRALAAAAETFGLPLVVFTPSDAPRAKLAAIGRHGARLRAEGRDYDDAEGLAKAYARDTGAEFISPYSDLDVIAGAATIALEVFEDRPDTDVLVVPVGGGGLISGVAVAARALRRDCRVVGVELEVSSPFRTSVAAGKLVEIVPGETLADGLVGNPDPETITFGFIQQFVDEIVTVSEASLAASMAGLLDEEHLVAEGAGAAAAAAVAGRRVPLAGRNVVVLVTGANVDRATLDGACHRPPV